MDKKERKRIASKKWKDNNKEATAIYSKEYYENNKEKENEKCKKYNQTPKGIKSRIISHWKERGIIDEDLDAVYDYYVKQTNCMICLKKYKDNFDRCLDHDHTTGEIRYICCRNCNSHFLR